MAALNRPVTASYEVHEKIQVDTQDNEDHTFCGIMFPIKAKQILPVERIVIHSVAVRGQLGEMSVWVSDEQETANNDNMYNFRITSSRRWTKLYHGKVTSSVRVYKTLDFSNNPVVLQPGQVRLLYIHSTLPGDEGIVYDDSVHGQNVRYSDDCLAIYSGKAHLSPVAFGLVPIWGWGNAWRDRREFVGQINYGTVFKLWNPERHTMFGNQFHAATQTMLLCQRDSNSPLSSLPDECIYYILNMCKWDWFGDDGRELKIRYRARKRLAATQQEANTQEEDEAVPMEQDEAVPMEQDDDDDESVRDADDDQSHDSDDDDTAWERANGYHADARTFRFHDVSSDEEEEDDTETEERTHRAFWFRRHFARIHVLGALGGHRGRDDDGSDYIP